MRIDPVVTVIFSRALDRIGEPAISQYMDVSGSKSIKAAIEGDKTLGGVVSDCIVIDAKEADFTVGTIQFYGAIFTLKVYAAGS